MIRSAVAWWRAHAHWLVPTLAICALVGLVAWGFVFVTLHHTASMGLPLDDSYIYLTYAKQAGRGHPFTYYPGGGYSAGSTSVLWPLILAPFWTLGARGHALVWVSYGLCTALLAACAVGAARLVRVLVRTPATPDDGAGRLGGLAAALLVLLIAPFAWGALSGMEVALAAALLVAMILLLLADPKRGPPRRLLGVCLAAASLSRPELTLLVAGICGCTALARARSRDWRAAAWWLSPLLAPALWLAANRLLAGNFFPNTGVAKSHFYLPGFDASYWVSSVIVSIGQMAKGLFYAADSPLVWPKTFVVLWLLGAIRIAAWSRRQGRPLAGAVVIAGPILIILAVIASSGMWQVQHYRYIAAAFPLLMIAPAIMLSPPEFVPGVWRRVYAGLGLAVAIAFGITAWPAMRADMMLYAQGALDTNMQVVAIGKYVHAKLPEARIMFHDAGAVAYYGDTEVFDMLGLVTNHQANVANNGPGARFEFLESLPPEQRPTHFVYYPAWMGNTEFYGDVVMTTPIYFPFVPKRLASGQDMQIIEARWDHVGTGERPLDEHPGWALVDRVDIADLESERAHGWSGSQGRRHFADPTIRWSHVESEIRGGAGLVVDGGRTIRPQHGATEPSETFAVELDPSKPARVILRTGGQTTVPWDDTIGHAAMGRLTDAGGRELGQVTVEPPAGQFVELTFEVPAGTFATRHPTLQFAATGMYRVYHWFVLQPE